VVESLVRRVIRAVVVGIENGYPLGLMKSLSSVLARRQKMRNH